MPYGLKLEKLKEVPELVKDPYSNWPSFSNVLYASLDYEFLILYILLFVLFDVVTGESIISIGIVYLVEKAIYYLRKTLGERNFANKSLVDDRFLL